jgi:dTDP-4-amino-4,6-dideoxygalactose transaminase
MFKERDDVTYNYSYFPIFVNEAEFGMSRDALYQKMKSQNVLGRRYFYPLISDFAIYRGLPSASKENLPVATRMANEVICLPMYAGLTEEDVERVLNAILIK